jgi:hypothetical protein
MRGVMASTLRVIGQTAGILAAVFWGWTCWDFLAQQDVNATSQEIRRDFRLLGLAAVSLPIVGLLVYWPFAALADRIAISKPREVSLEPDPSQHTVRKGVRCDSVGPV